MPSSIVGLVCTLSVLLLLVSTSTNRRWQTLSHFDSYGLLRSSSSPVAAAAAAAADSSSILSKNCGAGKGTRNASYKSLKHGGHNRINSGYNASYGDFPSFVALRTFYSVGVSKCGGSLLSDRLILTAAHCVKPDMEIVKVEASFGVVFDEDRGKESQIVDKICVPKEYSELGPDFDFAVLKLDAPVELSDRVQPVCLPDRPPEPSMSAFAVGGGYVSGSPQESADRIQVLPIGLVECAGTGGTGGSNKPPSKYTLCFRGLKPSSICKGDSGGPAIVEVNRKQTIVGVTSRGPFGCLDSKRFITKFTDTFKLKADIIKTINNC